MGKTNSLNPIDIFIPTLINLLGNFPRPPVHAYVGRRAQVWILKSSNFLCCLFSMHPAFSCWWAWAYQLLFAFETKKKTKRKPFWQNATNQKIHCKRSNLGVNPKISFVEITRWKLTSLFWRVPPPILT